MPRTFKEIQLKDGQKVTVKVCEHHGQKFCYPEFETVKKVCEETGRAYRDVYDEASAWREDIMKTYEEKKRDLYEKMKEYTKEDICIAFSGGVDSSLLLNAGKRMYEATEKSREYSCSNLPYGFASAL